MSNYGNPVQMREAIQVQRVELATDLAAIAIKAQDETLADNAAMLFDRLVSDVDNEMLSVSIDKGLPFLAYAKTPSRRWDSERRTNVSLKKFLKTRLGIVGDQRDALIAAICDPSTVVVAPAADNDSVCNYPS